MSGPTYRVLNRGLWATEEKPKPEDQSAQVVAWIVGNCQGVGLNKVSEELAKRFPSRRSGSWRDQLSRGELSKLLVRDGEGGNTAWRAAA
jgi:hypothetical protein